ncbi:hypothetical protein Droror1_Dr00020535, partial [Drosera rotundifolia]
FILRKSDFHGSLSNTLLPQSHPQISLSHFTFHCVAWILVRESRYRSVTFCRWLDLILHIKKPDALSPHSLHRFSEEKPLSETHSEASGWVLNCCLIAWVESKGEADLGLSPSKV